MSAHYTSKHGDVSKCPEELYMVFSDLSNFARMVPPGVQADVQADFNNLSATVQGMTIAVRVDDRQPYRLIRIGSAQSPLEFVAVLHFEPSMVPGHTDFFIDLDANLNFMLKAMLGSKLQEAIDKLVDGLVAASEGRMPAGM